MKEFIVTSLAEMDSLANRLVKKWRETLSRTSAQVVLLRGDLGAGKTTFTQAVAMALGYSRRVISPTFVLLKKYPLPPASGWKFLYHLDCYRLNSSVEAEALKLPEIFADPDNLVLIEWPERIADILPALADKLDFIYLDDTTRKIIYR